MSIVYIPGVPRMVNPSGYQLYEFLKKTCLSGDNDACDWLALFLRIFSTPRSSASYSTDFSDSSDTVKSSNWYRAMAGITWPAGYYYAQIGDIYVFPHKTSKSVGYVDFDDINIECSKYFASSLYQYSEQTGECKPPLVYSFNASEYWAWYPYIGGISSAKVMDVVNLKDDAPIFEIKCTDITYMSVVLTPDLKIGIKYMDRNLETRFIRVDYNIKDNWLFILTDIHGLRLNLYDSKLRKIAYLDFYQDLRDLGVLDSEKELYIYKGYYNVNGGIATFQYDWLSVNTIQKWTPHEGGEGMH